MAHTSPTAIEASTTDTMLMPREVPLSNAELITSQPEMPETPQVNDVASCLASLPAQSPQNLQPGTSIKTQNPQQLIPVERDSQIMHKIQQHPPLDVLQQCPHLQDELCITAAFADNGHRTGEVQRLIYEAPHRGVEAGWESG